MSVTRWLAAMLAVASASCGSDDTFDSKPVDVSGSYSVSVTNKSNACNFPNWEQNASTTGVPVTITQTGESIIISIDGLAGSLVTAWLGASTFEGTVEGNKVVATYFGSQPYSQATCTYTIKLVMDGTLTGDALQGVLRYTAETNGSPDCGTLETCETLQEFSGSRPPK